MWIARNNEYIQNILNVPIKKLAYPNILAANVNIKRQQNDSLTSIRSIHKGIKYPFGAILNLLIMILSKITSSDLELSPEVLLEFNEYVYVRLEVMGGWFFGGLAWPVLLAK